MYGTRCLLPDVVQADMQVWHEVSRAGRELINLLLLRSLRRSH